MSNENDILLSESEIVDTTLDKLRTPSSIFSDDAEGAFGYKDLKDSGYREFMCGMACVFAKVKLLDFDDYIEDTGTGSDTLDKIISDIRENTRRFILEEISLAMEISLEHFLDHEAEGET